MGVDDVPLDDKAKRMRDLLSSFYSTDPPPSLPANTSSKYATLDTINTTTFDADQYMNLLVQKSNLEGLLQRHVEMAAEIKNLDTDLQMLVYENYNKFISATETIKRMNSNIVGMESNMEQLLEKILTVQSKSDGVNTSLFEKREHIEKLHRTRNLLCKVQFIYDLPSRLGKCIKFEAYADAVRFYTGAMPIFKAYGDSSFQDCKRASEEAVAVIIRNLQGKVYSDSESIQSRAEAAVLLKQLNFPIDSLKAKLLEKLEHSLTDLQLDCGESINVSTVDKQILQEGSPADSTLSTTHEDSTHEFAEAIRAYRAIFPDSEKQLTKLAKDIVRKHFEATEQRIRSRILPEDLLKMLRIIWSDVLLMDEVLPEAALPDFSFEAARASVELYIDSTFSQLIHDISDSVTKIPSKSKEATEEALHLQSVLDDGKRAVTDGSMNVLKEFRLLLDADFGLLLKLRGFIIDWVQEGFQNFFKKLDDRFLSLSGQNSLTSNDKDLTEGTQKEKVLSALVLLLSQLCVFIEQSAIPRITEEIASSFSGGGLRGYEYGPAFVPAEICRIFRSDAEKFLGLYIRMRSQKVSVLLRKRFTAPNWVKHKEPREVHMFVDLFLQELDVVGTEARQILPQGLKRKHRRTDSNGSTASSRSNPLRDDKITRSNTQKARSQLLETHLAKLFKQKMEIFTKVEHTQDSVLTTILKLCLKSLQEFVRLHTFNRSGFQQIQLDIQFLRTPVKDIAEDEAAVDFLLDEVIVAAAERCLDPIPLEPPILDKLIQEKLSKTKEQNFSSA